MSTSCVRASLRSSFACQIRLRIIESVIALLLRLSVYLEIIELVLELLLLLSTEGSRYATDIVCRMGAKGVTVCHWDCNRARVGSQVKKSGGGTIEKPTMGSTVMPQP